MEKIRLICFLFFANLSFAQEITIISGGSATGTTAQRSDLYETALLAQGYSVKRAPRMPSDKVVDFFMSTNDPVILPWNTTNGYIPFNFSVGNFVSIEFTAPMYLCFVNAGVSPEIATVAVPRTNPTNPIKDKGYSRFIPYKNSGAVANAALAKEIDVAYVSQQSATILQSAGLSCETLSGVDQTAFLLAKNVDIEILRKHIQDAYKHADFVAWQKKSGVTNYLRTDDIENDYAVVLAGYKLWAGN